MATITQRDDLNDFRSRANLQLQDVVLCIVLLFCRSLAVYNMLYILQYDDMGNLTSTLCAIDAVSYRNYTDRQYKDEFCVRDLNKAFTGFSFNVGSVSSCQISHSTLQEHSRNNSQSECSAVVNYPHADQSHAVLHTSQPVETNQMQDEDQPQPVKRIVSQSEEEYYTASENEQDKEDQYGKYFS